MNKSYEYEYEWDTQYCYPNSKVLKNILDIRDANSLSQAERKLTGMNMLEIKETPIKGNFDLLHLQNIHKYIFSDIYSWAGEHRMVNIAKGNMFCNYMYLDRYACDLFNRLEKENYLLDTPKEEMSNRLAYYLSEINVMHPFREGNGRAQRIFIEYLALVNGYHLDFSDVSAAEMIEASARAFDCDYTVMNRLFGRIVDPISKEEQIQNILQIAGQKSDIMQIIKDDNNKLELKM